MNDDEQDGLETVAGENLRRDEEHEEATLGDVSGRVLRHVVGAEVGGLGAVSGEQRVQPWLVKVGAGPLCGRCCRRRAGRFEAGGPREKKQPDQRRAGVPALQHLTE